MAEIDELVLSLAVGEDVSEEVRLALREGELDTLALLLGEVGGLKLREGELDALSLPLGESVTELVCLGL